MTQSFLLRFQDRCEDGSSGPVATGTETTTKVLREQPDADPTKTTYRLLPSVEDNSGTMTNTRIHREQSDADYSSNVRIVPVAPVAGTGTATAVKMENDDQDPRQHELRVLPKCSSY